MAHPLLAAALDSVPHFVLRDATSTLEVMQALSNQRLHNVLRNARLVATEEPTRCGMCNTGTPVPKLCKGCHGMSYCSIDCHRAHWPVHKRVCGTNDTILGSIQQIFEIEKGCVKARFNMSEGKRVQVPMFFFTQSTTDDIPPLWAKIVRGFGAVSSSEVIFEDFLPLVIKLLGSEKLPSWIERECKTQDLYCKFVERSEFDSFAVSALEETFGSEVMIEAFNKIIPNYFIRDSPSAVVLPRVICSMRSTATAYENCKFVMDKVKMQGHIVMLCDIKAGDELVCFNQYSTDQRPSIAALWN